MHIAAYEQESISVPSTTGERIAARREDLGLKKADLARLLRTSRTNITNWENNKTEKMSGELLTRLCQVLKSRAEYFLWGELPVERFDVVQIPVLNTSSSLEIRALLERLEGVKVGYAQLVELGIKKIENGAWYLIEHNGHQPTWRMGDAMVVDRSPKEWTVGQWYVAVVDARLDVWQVRKTSDATLTLADGSGASTTRPLDRAVLYLGHILCSCRLVSPANAGLILETPLGQS